MSTFDRSSYFYSGQGVVLISDRDASGKPKRLLAQGDVKSLRIEPSTTTLEVKESQSGQRGVVKEIETEIKVNLTMSVANHCRDTLAMALRGDATTHAAGTVSGEALKWYAGGVQPAQKMRLSSVAVKRGAQALILYSDAVTPWDYKLNSAAGSVQFNDGALVAVDKITTGGTAPTVITVGSNTRVTVANTSAVGDWAVFTGFAGADAALINGKAFRIVAATATYVDLALNTTGKTITLGTPLSCFEGQALTIDYTHEAQHQVDALTQSGTERYLRFEGLNTQDDLGPVVVEVFKFRASPTRGLDLISEAATETLFEMGGSVLRDDLQESGSKYFRERLLR